jgi:hypothetical protein
MMTVSVTGRAVLIRKLIKTVRKEVFQPGPIR